MKRFVLSLVAVFLAGAVCPAAEQKKDERHIFPALGIVAERKVDVPWNRFYDHAGLSDILKKLHEAFPTLTATFTATRCRAGKWSLTRRGTCAINMAGWKKLPTSWTTVFSISSPRSIRTAVITGSPPRRRRIPREQVSGLKMTTAMGLWTRTTSTIWTGMDRSHRCASRTRMAAGNGIPNFPR